MPPPAIVKNPCFAVDDPTLFCPSLYVVCCVWYRRGRSYAVLNVIFLYYLRYWVHSGEFDIADHITHYLSLPVDMLCVYIELECVQVLI